ncbi:CocE/NonD family hydrolase [Nocardia sp. ET3-3]|uniref:CocE/NonD family hydrolase n=1 Tax=Nocardia terrae TaxID=2675851 RepID=A0A7K1V2L9_9NOCA|nr:CocE/NonD family hydrolase [Nocardia terrae]MVU80689.1 CocE/NonD family hydrolase [Nocardia terrae]
MTNNKPALESFALPAGIVAERDVPVEMRDGRVLSVNVFRPEAAGKYPVIFSFTPYGKDVGPKEGWLVAAGDLTRLENLPELGSEPGHIRVSEATSFEAPDPAFWVPAGYVVVIADVRGYFKSRGVPGIFSKKDAADCYDLVEWGALQPWSSGDVGLNGVSYLAISQWYTAAQRPPHLKAMITWQGVSDLVRDVLFHGGIPETRFTRDWMKVMRVGARYPTPMLYPQVLWVGQKYLFGVVQRLFPAPEVDNIEVPALICGTWSDQGLHTRGSFEGFSRIRSQHKWLYTHGRKKWEVYYSDEGLQAQKQFFDYFLKDIPNGMMDVPRVRVEVRETREKYDVRYENEWPPVGTRYRERYLAHPNSLVATKQLDSASVGYDSRSGTGVHFDLRFDEDTELTGYMKLKLWVSAASGRDMDLFVGVKKLDVDGNEVYFEGGVAGFEKDMAATGWLRVSQRELDPARSKPWKPYLSHRRAAKIRPGDIVPVEIEILPSSTLFRTGETLRLIIQGSDISGNPSVGHTMLVNKGRHHIHFGGRHDSHLLVPVID